jgi:hypothetical protein
LLDDVERLLGVVALGRFSVFGQSFGFVERDFFGLLAPENAALTAEFFVDEVVEPERPTHLPWLLARFTEDLAADLIHNFRGVERAFGDVTDQFVVANVTGGMPQQPRVVLLKEFADDIFDLLRAGPFGQRFRGEASGFELVKLLPAFLAFPESLAAQFGFERFQFAEQGPDRIVKGFDDIRRRLFAVENVGGHAQSERGGVERLFRMPFQSDLQVNGVRREMFEVLFQLGNFFVDLFAEQLVAVQVFGYEIPRE